MYLSATCLFLSLLFILLGEMCLSATCFFLSIFQIGTGSDTAAAGHIMGHAAEPRRSHLVHFIRYESPR